MKPIIALVGRPNVGKSTLFNRITRSRDAIVDDMPGVTRDRHFGNARWDDKEFTVVDTGGFLGKDEDYFADEIRFQVKQAIDGADVVVLVLDGKSGISPFDNDLIEIIRTVDLPVYYIVNKVDGETQEDRLYEFYSLGIEDPYPVSGEHGYGVPDFLDDLVKDFPEVAEEEDDGVINISVVGRPNVGKSSLINKILGEKRLVVSDVAGTTRDSIDSMCEMDGQTYRLIDTAGIRRKSKVSEKLEKFSVIKSLKSLDRCDVALILIDSSEGITDQDITIAGYAFERGCACIFLFNKWDLVDKQEKSAKDFYEDLGMAAKYLYFAPAMTISALTGLRVKRIFSMINDVYKQYSFRIGTSDLNRIVERAIERNEPSLHKGKRLKFYYSTQVATKPPTFVLFVNYAEAVHFSYKRYLTNQIRERIGLDQTPVKIFFRQRTGRIEFETPDFIQGRRNKGAKEKVSRNKEKKRKERKAQAARRKKKQQ